MLGLTDLDPDQIAERLDLKPYQGRQIFEWLHRRRIFDFAAMTNLSKDLRRRLEETCVASQLKPVNQFESSMSRGTRKVLFRLRDGETIESVLIRDRKRTTICLSTQVGCPLSCSFCATGLEGYVRNCSAGEIVEQALHLVANEDLRGRTPNLVYMGMGEPFLNYDATVQSIRLLMSSDGLGVGARRITVSTVGHIPGIERFGLESWQVRLSVSLHAANNKLRSRLVPMNRKYPLAELMKALHDYVATTGRQITIEWVLLDGVNDRPSDAMELAKLVSDLKCSVNLIPYNPVEGVRFAAPSWQQSRGFLQHLTEQGINATLRTERGGDINAACGQLRRRQK
jgi:23S rRNA (adenine2503-C2)-methyltransferase